MKAYSRSAVSTNMSQVTARMIFLTYEYKLGREQNSNTQCKDYAESHDLNSKFHYTESPASALNYIGGVHPVKISVSITQNN